MKYYIEHLAGSVMIIESIVNSVMINYRSREPLVGRGHCYREPLVGSVVTGKLW